MRSVSAATNCAALIARVAAPEVEPDDLLPSPVLLGCRPWSAAEMAAVEAGEAACPVCGGQVDPATGRATGPRLKGRAGCAYCTRCALDGRVDYSLISAPAPRDRRRQYAPPVSRRGERLKGGRT